MVPSMNSVLTFTSAILILAETTSTKVLLVSMDGFRWDYIKNFSTPNFDDFAETGVKADYITSAFITKTFPCHYTLATGLYEESHGIVSNSMYDPIFDEYFNKRNVDSRWWDAAEPIWVTVQRHGLRSGVYFWPGSEAEIRGKRPNIWFPYQESVPYKERVDAAILWLSNDSYNIDLAMVYFNEPDTTGHKYGPYAQQMKDMVYEMDGILGYIVQSVNNAGLSDKLNIIVTSDHGMTQIDLENQLVDLSQYVDLSAIEIFPDEMDAVLSVKPFDSRADELYNNLSSVQHMTVYRKEDLPDHWHYKNNRRVLSLVLVADEGWTIVKNPATITKLEFGGHGYDNGLPSMKPIFFASGPGFKTNVTIAPFNTVDIYPLVCRLLGIEPAPNNGTLDNTIGGLVTVDVSGASSFSCVSYVIFMLSTTLYKVLF